MGQTLSEPVVEKVRDCSICLMLRHNAMHCNAGVCRHNLEQMPPHESCVTCVIGWKLTRLSLKISDDGQDDRVAFGVSAMQGWRISMEDAHAAVLDLQAESEKDFETAPVEDRLSFFGVYDGHGGDKVALFAGENIHKILAKQEAFKNKDFEQALRDGFLATDRAILSGIFGQVLR